MTSKKTGKRTTRRSDSVVETERVDIASETGDFAEDKDAAAAIRDARIRPRVKAGKEIILDFAGVNLVTQSFVHALISDVLRSEGEQGLDHMVFDHCNEGVRGIVETVVQYSLETMESDSTENPQPPKKRLPQPTRKGSGESRLKRQR